MHDEISTFFLSSTTAGVVTARQINEILELSDRTPITPQHLSHLRKQGTRRLVVKYDGHIISFGLLSYTERIAHRVAHIFDLNVHPFIDEIRDPFLRWEDIMDLMLSTLVSKAKSSPRIGCIRIEDDECEGMCRRAQAYRRAGFNRESDSVFYYPLLQS